MKKFFILGLVLVLLTISVVPVMASGPNNGHGNGNGAGQNNGKGNQDRQQDRIHSNHGRGKNSLSSLQNSNLGLRKPFYLQGTIVAIDGGAKTLTIDVSHGNARVKQFIGGTDLVVTTVLTTRIFKILQGVEGEGSESEGAQSTAPTTSSANDELIGNPHAIKFIDLKTGDIVAIHGLVVGVVYTGTKITVFSQGIGGLPEANQP